MKKHTIASNLLKIFCSLLFAIIVVSCAKNEYVQNFDDVFDISGAVELNQKIENISSAEDLSGLFENTSFQIPEEMKEIKLDDIIDYYSKSVELTSNEIDMLLKNDSKTYIDVINRIGSLPPQIAALNIDFDAVKASPLNKYLIKQKANTENFYSDDYYSAVLALQKYMKEEVIEPMNNLKSQVITIGPGNPNFPGATRKEITRKGKIDYSTRV